MTTDAAHCMKKPRISIEQITEPLHLLEAPHWDIEAQVLYFVDILEQKIHCFDPKTSRVTGAYISTGMLGVAIPIAGQNNKFIGGAGTKFIEITWDPKSNESNPAIRELVEIDLDRTNTRFNDGKIDPQGRMWAGTMSISLAPSQGSLYRLGSDLVPHNIVSPVSISNGLVWSHDNKTFYYIDSPEKQVWAYDYNDNTGDLSNKRVLYDLKTDNVTGIPDGMTIDTAGNLWVACYDGARVIKIDSQTGKLLQTVDLPVNQVTSIAFGGPNLDILYVTTARQNLTPEQIAAQPMAGSLFAIRGLNAVGKRMLSFKM